MKIYYALFFILLPFLILLYLTLPNTQAADKKIDIKQLERYYALFLILLPSLVLLFLILPNTQAADNSVDLAQSDAWVAARCPFAFSIPCGKGAIRFLDDLLPVDDYIDLAKKTNDPDILFKASQSYYMQAKCTQDKNKRKEYGKDSWQLLNLAIENGHKGAIEWLSQIQKNAQ